MDNLLGALTIAGHYIIPGQCIIIDIIEDNNLIKQAEVSLFFNHTLYRGNRVSKYASNELDAFNSPNFSPLVQGEPIPLIIE